MLLLRRTFAHFEPDERKQIGEKAKFGIVQVQDRLLGANQDMDKTNLASKVLEAFKVLFGIAQ